MLLQEFGNRPAYLRLLLDHDVPRLLPFCHDVPCSCQWELTLEDSANSELKHAFGLLVVLISRQATLKPNLRLGRSRYTVDAVVRRCPVFVVRLVLSVVDHCWRGRCWALGLEVGGVIVHSVPAATCGAPFSIKVINCVFMMAV